METSKIPAELKYTKSHEWVKLEGTSATVGITDHAQSELTDIVFVDLPAVGKAFEAGAAVAVLESVKTVADVYAPGACKVTATNAELKAHPEYINQDPYGKGWLFRVELTGPADAGLFGADEYRKLIAAPG